MTSRSLGGCCEALILFGLQARQWCSAGARLRGLHAWDRRQQAPGHGRRPARCLQARLGTPRGLVRVGRRSPCTPAGSSTSNRPASAAVRWSARCTTRSECPAGQAAVQDLPDDDFRAAYTTAGGAHLLGRACDRLSQILSSVPASRQDPMAPRRRTLKEYVLGPDQPTSMERFSSGQLPGRQGRGGPGAGQRGPAPGVACPAAAHRLGHPAPADRGLVPGTDGPGRLSRT